MSPKRIQMSRQRPWRAENPDAVIVARPSKWGNPFAVRRDDDGGWGVYEDGIQVERADSKEEARDLAVMILEMCIYPEASKEPLADYPLPADIERELRGRDLACWCPLDQPCHADVLLDIANPEGNLS